MKYSVRIRLFFFFQEDYFDDGGDHSLDDDDLDEERNERERENARTFIDRLKAYLATLVAARGSIETDFRLQQFASDFCAGNN